MNLVCLCIYELNCTCFIR